MSIVVHSASPFARRIMSIFVLMAFASLALMIPSPTRAQVSIRQDPATRFEWRGQVEAHFHNEFKTKLDGGDEFDSWTDSLGGDFGGPLNESILIGVDADYQYAHYDFNLDSAPSAYGLGDLPREPWGAISTFNVTPNTTILVGNQFSVVLAAPIRFSAETGARRNGFTAGAVALVRWQITEDIRIGVGIGITSQLEGNAETFPLISFDWAISPALDLRTEGSWTQGGEVVLLWGPNKAVRLTLSAGYERNRFRLDDNGFVTDRNGIGEITSIPIEVGLRIRLFENAFFDFRVGLGVAGRFRVENSSGQKLYEESYDPSPRIGLGLTIPFSLSRSN